MAAPHQQGVVALLGRNVVGLLGSVHHRHTPRDLGYTYEPPEHVMVPWSLWHLHPEHLAAAPLLWRAGARDANLGHSGLRRGIQTASWDTLGTSAWAVLGLRPDRILAVRATGATSVGAPPGCTIRAAEPDDRDTLVQLALEELGHHARATGCGTSPDQDPATVAAMVSAWSGPDAPETEERAMVAQVDGRVVGVCTVHVLTVPAASPARYTLPARMGYVGLMSVTAAYRGRGIGAALSRSVLAWLASLADTPPITALNVIADNAVAMPFWSRQGYVPLTTVLTDAPTSFPRARERVLDTGLLRAEELRVPPGQAVPGRLR